MFGEKQEAIEEEAMSIAAKEGDSQKACHEAREETVAQIKVPCATPVFARIFRLTQYVWYKLIGR